MNNLEQLGQSITSRRQQLRLTQTDLAAIVGLSDRTVRGIEQGKDTVAFKNWILVANAIGLAFQLTTKKMSDETRKSI